MTIREWINQIDMSNEYEETPLHTAIRLDLSIDPPPDLAIEIDVTSFTKIEDYLCLGIPEVWIYKQNDLSIHLFQGNSYLETQTSLIFPSVPIKQIIPQYVSRAWQFASSVALREFINFLSQQ